MCLATSNDLLLVLTMPQNAFFSRTRDLLFSPKTTQRHFSSTLHPVSPVFFATATMVAFVPLRNSRFNFHCYTQREATPSQKSARKWLCDLSWLLARKIIKGIHSCKQASPNRPISSVYRWNQSATRWCRVPLDWPQETTEWWKVRFCSLVHWRLCSSVHWRLCSSMMMMTAFI